MSNQAIFEAVILSLGIPYMSNSYTTLFRECEQMPRLIRGEEFTYHINETYGIHSFLVCRIIYDMLRSSWHIRAIRCKPTDDMPGRNIHNEKVESKQLKHSMASELFFTPYATHIENSNELEFKAGKSFDDTLSDLNEKDHYFSIEEDQIEALSDVNIELFIPYDNEQYLQLAWSRTNLPHMYPGEELSININGFGQKTFQISRIIRSPEKTTIRAIMNPRYDLLSDKVARDEYSQNLQFAKEIYKHKNSMNIYASIFTVSLVPLIKASPGQTQFCK